MKQTAVEWLIENSHIIPKNELNKRELIEQANEMFEQQIIDAYIECKRQYVIRIDCYPPQFVVDEAEQYYNETYNK